MPRSSASTRGLVSWALYDWANSAFPTVIQTFLFAAYFTRRVAATEAEGTTDWGLAVGVAGGITALSAPLLGAVADQGRRRKPWIAVFAGLCIAATAALWFVTPSSPVAFAGPLLVAGVTAWSGSQRTGMATIVVLLGLGGLVLLTVPKATEDRR